MIILFLLFLLGVNGQELITDPGFELSFENQTNPYWNSIENNSPYLFMFNNQSKYSEIRSHTGEGFLLLLESGQQESRQYIWQFKNGTDKVGNVEISFYLKIVPIGGGNKRDTYFSVKFEFIDQTIDVFHMNSTQIFDYLSYTEITWQGNVNDYGDASVVIFHRGTSYSKEDLNIYLIDDFHINNSLS